MRADAFEVLLIDCPENDLLEDVYNNVLTSLFTKSDDLDSLEDIKRYMSMYNFLNNSFPLYTVIALLFEGKVVGTTIFGIFECGSYCFIKGEYTGILKEARKNGAFDFLLNERMRIVNEKCKKLGYREIDFILNELESPEKITVNLKHVINTTRLWRMKGFRRIDFEFIQLPLSYEKSAISYFDLYIKPISEKFKTKRSLSASEMKGIIDSCQTFRISNDKTENYIEYQDMMKQIGREGNIKICHSL